MLIENLWRTDDMQNVFIIIIFFIQCIYTYITEMKYVPSEHSVAAILFLLFMVLISLVSVLNLRIVFLH